MRQPTTYMNETQLTVANRVIDASNAVTCAFRRFDACSTSSPPLVLLQQFRANLNVGESPAGEPT